MAITANCLHNFQVSGRTPCHYDYQLNIRNSGTHGVSKGAKAIALRGVEIDITIHNRVPSTIHILLSFKNIIYIEIENPFKYNNPNVHCNTPT